jgi:hypothetical protein
MTIVYKRKELNLSPKVIVSNSVVNSDDKSRLSACIADPLHSMKVEMKVEV